MRVFSQNQDGAKVSLHTGVHYRPTSWLTSTWMPAGKGLEWSCGEGRVWLTEVRREEEERETWSVLLMESDSQGGGRDNNTEKSLS